MKNIKQAYIVLLIIMGICLSGCAPVKPWERGNLAKPEMAFDFNSMQNRYREHVYNSREAALGGDSADGGGCGCY